VTPPTGFTHARYVGGAVCKVPDRYLDGVLDEHGRTYVIPGAVLGHGDLHVVTLGEAHESPNWDPCDADGKPLSSAPDPTDDGDDATATKEKK
jgi:hypothetical protein